MSKTVLVTAIGSFSAGAVIMACKREGYRVVGCDIYPAEWIVNSGDVDRFEQAPLATDTEEYRAFLKKLCWEEQVDYLLPLTDVEVDALQMWPLAAEELGAVICMSGRDTIALCRDKEKMEAFLREKGVCRTIPGHRLSEVLLRIYTGAGNGKKKGMDPVVAGMQFMGLTFPLVMKPVDGRSSQGLRILESTEELMLSAKHCHGNMERFILQPKIEGNVITVDVVRRPETGECVCIPRRELLRTPNGAGTSVKVFRSEKLEAQCRDIARELDIRGCVNFEFIEAAPGEWYFLECNPRFSGGVAFTCMAGYDMVKNHLRCFEGGEIETEANVEDQYIARRYTEYRMSSPDTEASVE